MQRSTLSDTKIVCNINKGRNWAQSYGKKLSLKPSRTFNIFYPTNNASCVLKTPFCLKRNINRAGEFPINFVGFRFFKGANSCCSQIPCNPKNTKTIASIWGDVNVKNNVCFKGCCSVCANWNFICNFDNARVIFPEAKLFIRAAHA